MSQPPREIKSISDFVAVCGGKHPIRKVLIANNGIGAVKEIRSVRQWCYHLTGNEREIQFVVMATPEDIKVRCLTAPAFCCGDPRALR